MSLNLLLYLKKGISGRGSAGDVVHLNFPIVVMMLVLINVFNNKCSERVAIGRALDLPVYFGDAGSREVKQISELKNMVLDILF